jgi:hypothetical protein
VGADFCNLFKVISFPSVISNPDNPLLQISEIFSGRQTVFPVTKTPPEGCLDFNRQIDENVFPARPPFSTVHPLNPSFYRAWKNFGQLLYYLLPLYQGFFSLIYSIFIFFCAGTQ